ncbi:hypothetical protein OAT84_02590 [Gammaproteobacteria bacterium]|nr:hypothetical protein [Gammaproteobacteria bacterium]
MYWLLLLCSCLQANTYMTFKPVQPRGLSSILAMILQMALGAAFYIGIVSVSMSIFRLSEYYTTRGERIENIVTLGVIGLIFILISFIQPSVT